MLKVYEVIKENNIIGYMGVIKNFTINTGSLQYKEGASTGLSLNNKFEVKRDKFYSAILTYWFNGVNTEKLEKILNKNDYLGLKFNYIKNVELKYNN